MSEYESELEKHNDHIEKSLHDIQKENDFYYWAIQRLILAPYDTTFEIYSFEHTQSVVEDKIAALLKEYMGYKVEEDG